MNLSFRKIHAEPFVQPMEDPVEEQMSGAERKREYYRLKSEEKVKRLVDWIKNNNGRYPTRNKTSDKTEREWANFMQNKRNYRADPNSKKPFFDSDQEVAVQAGYPDLFDQVRSTDNLEEKSNQDTQVLLKWIKKNGGIYPSNKRKDATPEEVNLARWLMRKRAAKLNGGVSPNGDVFYGKDEETAKQAGYPKLFDPQKEEKSKRDEGASNQKTQLLINWIKREDRTPRKDSENPEEKSSGKFLSHRRQAKKGLGGHAWYQTDEEMADKAGIVGLFDRLIIEGQLYSIEKLKKIKAEVYFLCDPKIRYKGKKTYEGFTFVFDFKPYYCGIGLLGRNRSKEHFSPSFLKGDKTPDKNEKIRSLLNVYDIKELDKITVKQECNILEALEIERQAIEDFGRISNDKSGILLNVTRGGEWNAGRVFSKAYEVSSNKKTRGLVKWMRENNRTPRAKNRRKTIDKVERYWGEFIATRKKARGTEHFYYSDQEILEKAGYPKVFGMSFNRPDEEYMGGMHQEVEAKYKNMIKRQAMLNMEISSRTL